MKLFRSLLEAYGSSAGAKRLLLRALLEFMRRVLIFLGDPSYRTTIHGKEILLPVSHKLPIYVANYPYYDELPVRLTNYLRKKDGFLAMVDVGANIGDTILSCFAQVDDRFLGVEVNPDFVWYLRQNCAKVQNFSLVEAF